MRKPIFKLQKNIRFNYTPRYYKGKDLEDNYEFGNKFEASRSTFNDNDIAHHWREAREESRTRSNSGFSKMFYIILAILLFLFLWFIDFDLSIFTAPR